MNVQKQETIKRLRQEFKTETGAESNMGDKDFDKYIYWLEDKVVELLTKQQYSNPAFTPSKA